jgi:hypothetical protein
MLCFSQTSEVLYGASERKKASFLQGFSRSNEPLKTSEV